MKTNTKIWAQFFSHYANTRLLFCNLFFGMLLLSTTAVWGESRRIYFDYSSVTWWTDDAKIDSPSNSNYMGCHAWNNSSSEDYSMERVPGESYLLYCDIDDSYTSLLFFRCTELSMSSGSLWNKTYNYEGISSNNRFKIKNNSEKVGGIDVFMWADENAAIRWTPGVAIDGLIDVHNPHAQAFSFTGDVGVYTVTLSAHATYQFNILDGSTRYTLDNNVWTSNISNYTLSTSGYDIRLATAAGGTYTFTYNKSSHQLSVTYPSVTHPSIDYCYLYGYNDWINHYLNIWGSTSGIEGTSYPGTNMYNYFPKDNTNFYYFAPGDYTHCEPNDDADGRKVPDCNPQDGYGKYLSHDGSWGWRTWSFTIELNEQATTISAPVDPTVEFNGAALSSITPPTRVGYVFAGYWSNAACDAVKVIDESGAWVANALGYTSDSRWIHEGGNATLYAKWTANTTTVTLNANGGDSNSEVVATYDVLLPVFDAVTRSGHVLTGYWTTATGGTLVINENGSYVENSGIWNRTDGTTLTLYAQWVSLTTPSVVADSAYYLGEPVAIRLYTVSTGVKEPVVMFYVSDGTGTYQVLAAPGSVGEAATEYSTAHSATFYATKAATYTAYAVLYEGKFIDNFEDMASAWSGLGFGECARVANIEREPANGSNKVMKIMRNTAADSEVFNTAWTTTAEGSGEQSGWDFSYSYIHMRYYAPQPETPKVEYYNRDEDFRNTSVSDVSANTWHRLTFEVNGGVVDHIHPFVSSGEGNSIYIDDIVLSNEEEMTAILTSGSSAVTIKRPFVIYRTGDKADDPRKEDGDVESYDGGTIDKLIEYRMKVRARDQWYTLCLPFDVQAVQVWDAEEGKYYDIVPFYRKGGKYYNGHYIIRTPSRTTDLAIANFGEWNDPTSPTDYLPSKDVPYIIQWHDAYFQDLYISFFGEPRQTIPTSMTAGSEPSSDDVVNVCVNDAMTSGSAKGAYLLEGDYGDGAWLRLPDATASRTILPFECYILAKSTTAARYKVIRRGATPDDTPTGFPSLSDTPSTVTEKVLIDGQLYIIHGDKMYNTQGIVVEGGK